MWQCGGVGVGSRVTAAVRGHAELFAPPLVSSVQDLTGCVVQDFCNESNQKKCINLCLQVNKSLPVSINVVTD